MSGRQLSNRSVLRKLAFMAVAMFGFGYAMVPLYKKICEVTGVNQIARADAPVKNSQVDRERLVTMEFDANLRSDLPWQFKPLQGSLKVHPGQLVQVEYEVRNTSDRPITGQAIPSYGPQVAGQYFRKLDCFCFTQQSFAPGEVRRMPVVFVIEAGLPKDVNTVTLSYTFFNVEGAAPTAAAPAREGRTPG
ncbi:MAG TPA: cytochrome c oxidase assembly protein [Burkholderiales bacterium]|jgi:cytochrome c oxidase assembly protein subunit 11|nr:cytochrome c oxidase assembly protein [Burkholderiales bacterium]